MSSFKDSNGNSYTDPGTQANMQKAAAEAMGVDVGATTIPVSHLIISDGAKATMAVAGSGLQADLTKGAQLKGSLIANKILLDHANVSFDAANLSAATDSKLRSLWKLQETH